MDDKKKGLAALIVSGAPGKPRELEYGGDEEEVDGETVACEDMLTAINSNDVEAFKAALTAFLEHR